MTLTPFSRPAPSALRSHRRGTGDTTADFLLLASLPDGPERARVRRRLITAWLPMAHRLAGRFRSRGENLEDLQQVAALGLVKAVDRYDPHRSPAFETFAVPTITGELKRHFRDHTWGLHVPRNVQDFRNKVRAALNELNTGVEDRTPATSRIAAHTGLSEREVALGLGALHDYQPLSLDRALTTEDDSPSLQDRLGTTDSAFDLVDAREAAKPGLRNLPERERRMLYLRFFRHMTQSAIAAELGVSQMHVSRLLRHACHRVRQQAAASPAGEAA